MNRIKVRCWKDVAGCVSENQQTVFFTVPDFGGALRLYTCSKCGALFAVDPEQEHYLGRSFDNEKARLKCPECQNELGNALKYPESYRNQQTGEIDHFERPSREIPADHESVVLDLWNPLS